MSKLNIYVIVGIVIYSIIVFLIAKHYLKKKSADEENLKKLKFELDNLNNQLKNTLKQQNELHQACITLIERKSQLEDRLSQIEKLSEDFYRVNYESATERLNNSLEKAAFRYQEEEEKYKSEYLDMVKDCAEEFAEEFNKQQTELKDLAARLKELRAKTAAAVEQSKRELENKDKQNYYRLQVPKEDILEINKLREVIPYLRDKEALNKVIWKVYYEKPYTDLIGRVVSTKTTGIYKITNINNNMCYVGQAVDIADRWKTHIKRGCGAEPGGRNKLYPVMYEIGPENFTFEVIEKCDRNQLNEREDFWQDYFKAKEFGYSIK